MNRPLDLLTGKYKERLGNSKVEDIRKLSVEDMEAMIADLEEEDRKAEEEEKQRADLISRLTDPMVIGDTIAAAAQRVRTREELESLSTDGLKKIAARIFGEDTASAKKESYEDNGEKESAEQRRERILKMAALDETPAEELGKAPGEEGADSSAAEVASAEELEVRRREAFDLLTGKYKDSLGDKKVEDIRKLSVAEMEEQVKRIEANSILDAGKKESLKKPVEWWNRFTDDIHHAVIDGDFSYLGADATRGVKYLTKLVENGLLSKMPENIKLPENDYGFETSQAALGKYDSLINDSMVSRVEFSADEIKALIDDKISDEAMASDALRRTLDAEAVWNGASDSERQAILDGSFTDISSPLYQAYVELGPGAGLIGGINTVRETSLKALDLAADERLLAEANEQAGSFEPIRNADDIRDIPAVSDERLSQIANRALTPDEISRIRKAIYDWNMLENISKQDVLNGDLDYSGDDSLRTSMLTLREFGLIPSEEQEDDATAAAEAYEGNPDVTNIAESAA